jgi:hypothetical protein
MLNLKSIAEAKYGNEYAIYAQDDWRISPFLRINLGLRGTLFQQVGPYHSSVDGIDYQSGEVVKTYNSLEPRIFINTTLNDLSSSIKVRSNSYHAIPAPGQQ